MKKNPLIFTAIVVCSLLVFNLTKIQAQNTYDTYNPIHNPQPTAPAFPTSPNVGYTGEYQIFFDAHHWLPFANQHLISYRIEPVSFPFEANCLNGDCGNVNSQTRNMNMPNNFSAINYGSFNDILGLQIDACCISNMANTFDLSSINFTHTTAPVNRFVFPHTILKHTFYIHSGMNKSDPIIDQFSFTIDHTRGRSSMYPFRINNGLSNASTHDVTLLPSFLFPDQNAWFSGQTSNLLNTNDFYPLNQIDPNSANNIYAPSISNYSIPPENFIHPPPYSLPAFLFANSRSLQFVGYDETTNLASPGVLHTYIIDKSIDLKLVNPSEKIIYNPTDVSIDIIQTNRTITFPSGYTFKTVHGIYPTAVQIQNADPNDLYKNKSKVPVSSTLTLSNNSDTPQDETRSIYRVKTGNELIIEPCVNIYDAEIIVANR